MSYNVIWCACYDVKGENNNMLFTLGARLYGASFAVYEVKR